MAVISPCSFRFHVATVTSNACQCVAQLLYVCTCSGTYKSTLIRNRFWSVFFCYQREKNRQKELQAQQLEQARQQFILKTQNLLQFQREPSPPPKQTKRKVPSLLCSLISNASCIITVRKQVTWYWSHRAKCRQRCVFCFLTERMRVELLQFHPISYNWRQIKPHPSFSCLKLLLLLTIYVCRPAFHVYPAPSKNMYTSDQ